MAAITITIPDAALQDVIDALCEHGGYQPIIYNLEDGTNTPNPVTKAAFAKQHLIQYIKARHRDYMHALDVAAVPEPPDPNIT